MSTVSVIIPAFNAERFIAYTVQSVLDQSHEDWEMIVVNDGSEDMTEEIIRDFQRMDTRIRLISQINSGVSTARNFGFKHANSEYVVFLDADDLWSKDFLSELVQSLTSNLECGLAYGDLMEINEEGEKMGVEKRGKSGWLLDDLLEWKTHILPPPSGVLVRKEVVIKIGGFDRDLSNNADQDFYFRAARFYPFVRVKRVLLLYRVHAGNMHSDIKILASDSIKTFEKAASQLLFKSARFRKYCFANMYLILAINFIKHKKSYFIGIRYLIKSMATHPLASLRMCKQKLKK